MVPSPVPLNVPRSHVVTTRPFASKAIPGCHAFWFPVYVISLSTCVAVAHDPLVLLV